MPVFPELDWSRFDVHALAGCGGVTVVDERHAADCRAWLAANDYALDEVDCARGLAHLVEDLEGRILRWTEQFGYAPNPAHRSLDALADGFTFDAPGRAGRVLLLSRPDVPWQEDARWMKGLLDIARTHALQQLAVGARFFCVLFLPRDTPLIGQVYAPVSLPVPYWQPSAENPFRK